MKHTIVIHVGNKRDGVIYELSNRDLDLLREFEGAQPLRKVSISFDTKADYEETHGSIEEQIILLLTGLSVDRLARVADVSFYDAASGKSWKHRAPRAA
ncbi:MAG: hypothetical protein H6747_16875 [Deltaproteobacteria bacterium]|nr:hypothetical protein [Deltaproteobacteria bacterium]